MKRIYVSFITTVTIAIASTLVAFVTRDNINHVVTMDKSTQHVEQDSAFADFKSNAGTFN